MTLVVTILIGTGAVLIGSAMDNTPIIATFRKILSGQTVNWTGASAVSTSTNPLTPTPTTPPLPNLPRGPITTA